MDDIVRDAYDRIAERYAAQRDHFESLPYLERFASMLPPGGAVLDLGCGAGVPAAEFLTRHGFRVLGLDISPRMVELARRNVPDSHFEVRDMLALRPGEYAVDGIIALYSVFHTPREEHAGLFRTLRSFLPEGRPILVTMGADEWEGSEPDFFGAEMAWSHYRPEGNRALLEAAGFAVDTDEIDTSGGERHQVLLARATANEMPAGA